MDLFWKANESSRWSLQMTLRRRAWGPTWARWATTPSPAWRATWTSSANRSCRGRCRRRPSWNSTRGSKGPKSTTFLGFEASQATYTIINNIHIYLTRFRDLIVCVCVCPAVTVVGCVGREQKTCRTSLHWKPCIKLVSVCVVLMCVCVALMRVCVCVWHFNR